MEDAKFEILSGVKLVEKERIIKLVEDRGIKESAFSLKLKQCDLINIVSIYVNSMKSRIQRLETILLYEPQQEDADASDVKKIMAVDVDKTVTNTDEEFTEKEYIEEKEEEEEEEGELTMNSVEESTSSNEEKTVVTSSSDMSTMNSDEESTSTKEEREEEGESVAETMLQETMSTEDNESDLKTLTEKEEGGISTIGSAVAAARMQVVGRGFGRGHVFTRDSMHVGQQGFGRGHYVRKLQQQSLVTREDTSISDNPVPVVHGGLSMYIEKARIMRTRKHKR